MIAVFGGGGTADIWVGVSVPARSSGTLICVAFGPTAGNSCGVNGDGGPCTTVVVGASTAARVRGVIGAGGTSIVVVAGASTAAWVRGVIGAGGASLVGVCGSISTAALASGSFLSGSRAAIETAGIVAENPPTRSLAWIAGIVSLAVPVGILVGPLCDFGSAESDGIGGGRLGVFTRTTGCGPLGVRGRSSGGVLGVFGRAVPTGGTVGTTNFGPAFGGVATAVSSASRSPRATHSASAMLASIRADAVGATGRGPAGSSTMRGAMVGAGGLATRRAFSSSISTVLLASSRSANRIVMPTRPCSTDGVLDELITSASPSIRTPPPTSVSANRPRRPAGIGSAIGTKTLPRSA